MRRDGLTILEVLIALVIVGVSFAILSVAMVGSLQQTQRAGIRTQSTQYLNYFGRLVAGGDQAVLAGSTTALSWGYGALGGAFVDLPTGSGGSADAARYRAVIENVGAVTFVGASAVHYRVTVCTTSVTGETCVVGNTLGPAPGLPGGTPPLEGIN